MRLTAASVLFAVLLCAALPAPAAVVRGLYEAAVPVPDQSAQARDPAVRQALQAVLVRVTGTRDLPPAAAGLLARAPVLVQGYGYETAPAGKDLLMRARFDQRAVDAALRADGLPLWGANRPTHLVWIALRDDGQSRAILDATSAPQRAPAAMAAAEARGLPFLFPNLDATDRQLVTFNELWSSRVDGAVGAARRYNSDITVVARVGREGGRWVGRWTAIDAAGGTEEWANTHATLDDALAAGVHELADREAQRFAVQTGQAQELRLQVSGVDSLRDYGRVLSYLRGRTAVRQAHLEAVQADRLTFRLRIEGDPQALARVLAAGEVLQPREAGLFDSAWNYVLVR